MKEDLLDPPAPSLTTVEIAQSWRRVAALIDSDRPHRGFGVLRSRAAVLAIVVGFPAAAGGAAVALKSGLFDNPGAPVRLGERVEVASEGGGQMSAWNSTRGLCVGISVSGDERAASCGLPVRGAKPDPQNAEPPSHWINAVISSDSGDASVFVAGAVALTITRVDIQFVDGSVVRPALHLAPPRLDTKVKFFFARTPIGNLPPLDPVRAYNAYAASGVLLERHVVPVVTMRRPERQSRRSGGATSG